MKKTITLGFLIGISLVSTGCYVQGNIDINPNNRVTLKEFGQRFTKATREENYHQTSMVHQGIPETDQIRLWVSEPTLTQEDFDQIQVKYEGTVLSQVDRDFDQKHHSGLLTIRELEPALNGRKYVLNVEGPKISNHEITAHTKPTDHRNKSVRFLATSCFQPFTKSTELIGIREENLRTLNNLENLVNFRQEHPVSRIDFHLALGDQIYVDADAEGEAYFALLYGKRSENLRSSIDNSSEWLNVIYRAHFALDELDNLLTKVPTAMIWDDHEIRDGWGSHGNEVEDPEWMEYFAHAKSAFHAFQALRNPYTESDEEKSDYSFSFRWGIGDFFVFDGRSNRYYEKKVGFGEEQLQRFEDWLLSIEDDSPRVIVVGVPGPLFMSRGDWLPLLSWIDHLNDDDRDSMGSLVDERNRIVRALHEHVKRHPNHIFLSLAGDVHYTGVQHILDDSRPRDADPIGYEIVCSGLAQTKFSAASSWVRKNDSFCHGSGRVFPRNHGVTSVSNFTEILFEINPDDPSGRPIIKLMPHLGSKRDNYDDDYSYAPMIYDVEYASKNMINIQDVWENSNNGKTPRLNEQIFEHVGGQTY